MAVVVLVRSCFLEQMRAQCVLTPKRSVIKHDTFNQSLDNTAWTFLDSNSLDRNVQPDIFLIMPDECHRVHYPIKSIQLFHLFAKCQVCRRAKRKVMKKKYSCGIRGAVSSAPPRCKIATLSQSQRDPK